MDTSSNGGEIDDIAPSIDHYTENGHRPLVKRPSLDLLRDGYDNSGLELDPNKLKAGDSISLFITPQPGDVPLVEESTHVKFGWIRGVLIRCILSILGTMLYLRLSWVAGEAGILLGTVVALLSGLIVGITALSMCALCTNGEINAGGAYFMLSRSLGPEFGGSMGVVFALADGVASAMNVVGFAESMRDLLLQYNMQIVDGMTNDIRIIGAITMVGLFVIVNISISWEAKTELVLLVIVIASYVNFIVGTFIPPTDEEKSKGVTGYKWDTFSTNFLPAFGTADNFITIFAVYFPSVTGIMAGAGISGELKAPDKALPKGTLLGIAITSFLYILTIWLTGATCIRDASGVIDDLHNGSISDCQQYSNCSYGLKNDYNVIELISGWGPLIIAGTFATSLSSSMTLLVTSPRTVQALAKDRIFPYTYFFAKESGKEHQPRRAYVLVLIVCLGIVAIGDLNVVAPLISNFYLASFALINYACFDGSLAKSPNWRPSFKYYNMWVALVGALLCVIAMFLMQYQTALATIVVMFFLYVYVLRSKPTVNWGSSGQAHTYKNALQYMLSLVYTEEHVKNYRPSVMLFSGNPVTRPCLVNFVANITKNSSLFICGDVISVPNEEEEMSEVLRKRCKKIQHWLKKRRIKTFYLPMVADREVGFDSLLQLAGLGKLRPNIAFLGFKRNWKNCTMAAIQDYFQLINQIFDQNMGIAFLSQREGFDYSEQITGAKTAAEYADMLHRGSLDMLESSRMSSIDRGSVQSGGISVLGAPSNNRLRAQHSLPLPYAEHVKLAPMPSLNILDRRRQPSTSSMLEEDKPPQQVMFNLGGRTMGRSTETSSLSRTSSVDSFGSDSTEAPKRKAPAPQRKKSQLQRELDTAMNRYREKIKNGLIDVWWLFDDGGLTVLIAHLLTEKRSYLFGAKLRVFTYAQNVKNAEEEKLNLETLLKKFRIKVAEVRIIEDIYKIPSDLNVAEFDRIINRFRPSLDENYLNAQLETLKERTNLFLRTREFVMELSKDADLIVITAPIPRKDQSAYIYLAWLEMLTRDLSSFDPPVLLIRGNQENVLTFYS